LWKETSGASDARKAAQCSQKAAQSPDHEQQASLSCGSESAAPRDFTADTPNSKWMADITYIEMREG